MAHPDERKAEVLAVLAARGGNVAATARQTGVPRATITLWRDGGVSASVTESCHVKKAGLADCLEDLARQVLDLLPGKLPEASVRELNGTLKIAAETMQLLRGEPTSIEEHRGEWTEDECAAHVVGLVQRARDRRAAAGLDDPGGAAGVRPPPPVH